MNEPNQQDRRVNGKWILLVVLFAAVIRIVHNSGMMASPLYVVPLGGHRTFLEAARLIAKGDLLPGERPFIESSPLLPYVYAVPDFLFGENFLVLRLLGIAADLLTVFFVGAIGTRVFGRAAGIAAGLLYAVYGPAVYFSAELIYIPFVLALLSAALALLVGERQRPFIAGLLSGLMVALMPNAILLLPLFLLTLLEKFTPATVKPMFLFTLGSVLTILPVSAANYLNSRQFVLLTVTAGHNFYLGHNPSARAGYVMPAEIDGVPLNPRGSTFDAMKPLAERQAGRSLRDDEVSSHFFRQGMKEIQADLNREWSLFGARLSAFFQKSEYLTYGSYSYAVAYSGILRFLPRFDLLLSFAVVGLFAAPWRRTFLQILVPIVGSLLTVVLFFYLSRFRMLVIPSFCVLAAGGAVFLFRLAQEHRWLPLILLLVLGVCVEVTSSWKFRPEKSANEWNKEGGLLLKLGDPERAIASFETAQASEPRNPLPLRNLALVYERLGKSSEAAKMREMAEELARTGSE